MNIEIFDLSLPQSLVESFPCEPRFGRCFALGSTTFKLKSLELFIRTLPAHREGGLMTIDPDYSSDDHSTDDHGTDEYSSDECSSDSSLDCSSDESSNYDSDSGSENSEYSNSGSSSDNRSDNRSGYSSHPTSMRRFSAFDRPILAPYSSFLATMPAKTSSGRTGIVPGAFRVFTGVFLNVGCLELADHAYGLLLKLYLPPTTSTVSSPSPCTTRPAGDVISGMQQFQWEHVALFLGHLFYVYAWCSIGDTLNGYDRPYIQRNVLTTCNISATLAALLAVKTIGTNPVQGLCCLLLCVPFTVLFASNVTAFTKRVGATANAWVSSKMTAFWKPKQTSAPRTVTFAEVCDFAKFVERDCTPEIYAAFVRTLCARHIYENGTLTDAGVAQTIEIMFADKPLVLEKFRSLTPPKDVGQLSNTYGLVEKMQEVLLRTSFYR